MKPSDPRQPDEIDVHVGTQIRVRRKRAKMSMKHLAQLLGITYQQVQKYEMGTNRVPASRLAQIAKILEINPGELYVQLQNSGFSAPEQMSYETLSAEKKRLLKAFEAIKSPQAREALLDLADQMAKPFQLPE